MLEEPFLINPPKRLSRSGRLVLLRRRPIKLKHWSYVPIRYRNPLGETLVIVGGNPMPVTRTGLYYPTKGSSEAYAWARRMKEARERRKRLSISTTRRRRKSMDNPLKYVGVLKGMGRGHYHYKLVGTKIRSGKHKGERRKNNPVRKYRVESNAWYGQSKRHRIAALKGWKKRRRTRRYDNPRMYRRYRNPQVTIAGTFQQIMNIGTWFPLAITGGLSVTTAAVLPQMIAPVMITQPMTGPLVKYGIQLVSTFVGGGLVSNFVDNRHGDTWMITGVAYVGYQLLRDWVFKPFMPQFAVGLGDYEQYYSASEPFQQVGGTATGYGVSAFPEEVSAFPEEASAFPEEVSAYPYDGRYGY